MGHLANGDLGMEGSGKRFLENGSGGGGVGLDAPLLKFKKRRVSAIRDFPPGCGRLAAPVNGKLKVDAPVVPVVEKLKEELEDLGVESNSEKLKEGVEDVGVKSDSVREHGSLAEVKTSDVETTSPLEDLAQGEEGAKPTENTLEPMEVDTLPVDIVQAEGSNHNETSSPDNVAVESTEKKFPPRRKTSAIRDFAQGETAKSKNTLEPMPVDTLTPQSSVEPVQAEKLVQAEVLIGKQPSSPVAVNVPVDSMEKKFPPRRKTSAIRDFPPGCGMGAAPVNLKEVRKSVEQGVKSDAKQLEKRVQPGATLDSKMKEKKDVGAAPVNLKEVRKSVEQGVKADAKQLEKRVQPGASLDNKMKEKKDVGAGAQVKPVVAVKKETGHQVYVREKVKQIQTEKASIKPPTMIDKGSGNSGVKLGTESARLNKDTSLKKSSSVKSTKEPDPISLGSYDDREIVQSLMAKPNCPWGQGKKTVKPASVFQSPEDRKKISKTPSSIQLEVDQGQKASKSASANPSSIGQKAFKSASANQSSVAEHTGLESLDDRDIVQSLMAAPNCPWRNGKKPFKSPGSQAKKFVAR